MKRRSSRKPIAMEAYVMDKIDRDVLIHLVDWKTTCLQAFWFPGRGLRRGQRVTVTIAPAKRARRKR